MRTTLTLDDDVAAALERLRKRRDAPLKDIVNEALRRGLQDMMAKPKPKRRYESRVHDAGAVLMDVKDALAMLDEEHDRKKSGF